MESLAKVLGKVWIQTLARYALKIFRLFFQGCQKHPKATIWKLP